MPLQFERYFTSKKSNPLDEVQYTQGVAKTSDSEGRRFFESGSVEVPASWSQLAIDILVSKYFRRAGVPKTGHEVSVKQVIGRITRTLRAEARRLGYLDASGAKAFEAELNYLLIHQIGAFNSPVWFNLGLFSEYGIRGSGGNFAWNQKNKKIATRCVSSDSYKSS
jgi:ribonucleoside-diphosphate reductase alpha chain